MTTDTRLFVILVGVFLGVMTTEALMMGVIVAVFLGLIISLIKIENKLKNGLES